MTKTTTMMAIPFPTKYNESTQEFFLKASEDNTTFHPNLVFIGILIIPSILSGIFFYSISEFRGLYFQMAMLLTIAILINLYLFYKNTKWYQNQIKLLVAFDEMQIIQKGSVYWREELGNLKMTIEKEDKHQISIIKVVNRKDEEIYISYKKNNLQTLKNSFLITSKKDWIQLLNLLQS